MGQLAGIFLVGRLFFGTVGYGVSRKGGAASMGTTVTGAGASQRLKCDACTLSTESSKQFIGICSQAVRTQCALPNL